MSNRLLSEQELRDTGCLRSLEDELPFLKVQDTKTTAARDKWWITKGDEIFQLVPDCWLQSNCGTEQCTCEYQEWQSLKQSLEVKE